MLLVENLNLILWRGTSGEESQDKPGQPYRSANSRKTLPTSELAVSDVEIKLVISVLGGNGKVSGVMESEAASPMLSVSRFHGCNLGKYINPKHHAGILWVHLPDNNTLWVYPCLQKIANHYGLHSNLPSDWTRKERKSRKNTLHSRFMQPSCRITISAPTDATPEESRRYTLGRDVAASAGSSTQDAQEAMLPANAASTSSKACRQLQMYLPYLHWDTTKGFAARSRYLNSLEAGEEISFSEAMTKETKAILQANKKAAVRNSCHPRRSLDQYGYPGLTDTSDRDNDQVVSKNTTSAKDGQKMIMVDQLWLWVIEDDSDACKSSIVFTCFPKNDQEGSKNHADLQSSSLDSALGKLGDKSSAVELAALIVERAINVMLDFEGEESLRFLEIYREAIAKAVSIFYHTISFRVF